MNLIYDAQRTERILMQLADQQALLSLHADLYLGLRCPITKSYLYNFDPLKPHFHIVKLGFTEVYIIFLISAQNYRLWVLVGTASPRRFQRVLTIYVFSKNMKISEFVFENFQFLEVKFSIYLNRRVFVMPYRINVYCSKCRRMPTSDCTNARTHLDIRCLHMA